MKYFVSYMIFSEPNVKTDGNTEITIDHKIKSIEDIRNIEAKINGINKNLKNPQTIILNYIQL